MREKPCREMEAIGVWRLYMLKKKQIVLVKNGRKIIGISTASIPMRQHWNHVKASTVGGVFCNVQVSRWVSL